jgi:hypothetical protein
MFKIVIPMPKSNDKTTGNRPGWGKGVMRRV